MENATLPLSRAGPHAAYQRIATEEAFAPPELMQLYAKLLARSDADAGFKGLMGFYMSSPSERARHIVRCLTDLDQVRLQHMDEAGNDRQVIGITAPGVQVLDRASAVSMSRLANDQLADAVRRHPTRFTGMIALAPQDPAVAALEIERGVNKLGMNAAIINSHTQGEYLSDSKFWDIARAGGGGDAGRHDDERRGQEEVFPVECRGAVQDCAAAPMIACRIIVIGN